MTSDAPRPFPGGADPQRADREGIAVSCAALADARAPSRPSEAPSPPVGRPEAGPTGPVPRRKPLRPGAADPVCLLLHRHRELCGRAVDPLEVAAALEADGVTDRTALRHRYQDVFALAEGLLARVPRVPRAAAPGSAGPGAPVPAAAAGRRAAAPSRGVAAAARRAERALLPLLPGAFCALTVTALAAVPSAAAAQQHTLAGFGAAAVLVALVRVLRRTVALPPVAVGCAGWLFGHVLLGDRLPAALTGTGVPGPGPAAGWAASLLIAVAVAPAVWCTRRFAVEVERSLRHVRTLARFRVVARNRLAAVLGGFAVSLAAVPVAVAALEASAPPGGARVARLLDVLGARPGGGLAPAALAGPVALSLLLFLALLLTAQGCRRAATAGLVAAAAVEALALVAVLAARLPWPGRPGWPAQAVAAVGGPDTVGTLACTGVALGLLLYACRVLTDAVTHDREPE